MKITFASDNTAGIHPRILNAIEEANSGWCGAYGADPQTEELSLLIKNIFGSEAEAFPVWNGTGGNVVGLATLLKPYEAVLASVSSHLEVDECAAFERFVGSKIITLPHRDGKISAEQIRPYLNYRGDPHHVQPRVISISQTTEFGTVYSPTEIRELAEFAHSNGLLLHVDGARFTIAAAALGLGLRELSADLGVDALTLGGTKHGLLCGELVILFNRPEAKDFPFHRKQGMQLSSKMRYISAQFQEFLGQGLWKANAEITIAMTRRLETVLKRHFEIACPVQANAVFPVIPAPMRQKLLEKFHFYVWEAERSVVRMMCSFQTTEAEIASLAEFLSKNAN